MDYRVVFPTFSRPPSDYDRKYFDDLIRSLDALVVAIRTAGEGRQTTIILTDLQSNDSGLSPGTMFEVNGALRISKLNLAYLQGSSGKGHAGSVSVTT